MSGTVSQPWFDGSRAQSCPVTFVAANNLNPASTRYHAVAEGLICPLLVAWQNDLIIRAHFLCHHTRDEVVNLWQQHEPQAIWSAETTSPFAVQDLLYGERKVTKIPLVLSGTPFQQRVWRTLAHVPMGQVISYGQLAQASGSPRGARAVGHAMAVNPVPGIIPCHRVIRQDGQPGDFGYGTEIKGRMLDWEARHGRHKRSSSYE
nr:methylated-DNA--[protein]-cysteine S-methyltransferase [uncultured Desulfuromonas sp.]